ncbi:hypothetical protein BGX24_011328 [Mortierella sp. AD032]|nr:hypothetical protein BGX24_011328 [Mortierella sp. AD032]
MSNNTRSTDTKLSVLIAGAGLVGLMLGTLLEKSNISNCIYERTADVKPLVLSVDELDDTVKLQISDGSIYEGDILVGADGAYSAVRQRLYKSLKNEGKLSASDQEELPINSTCLFGQTDVIDYEAYFPEFQELVVRFHSIMGDGKPYTGKALGYLYDMTPKDRISKVMLEEKVFETWHSGLVLNPAGTQGPTTAIHDAIAISNLLDALPTNTT